MYVIGIYPRKSVYRDNSDSVQVQVNLCKEYARIMYNDKELEFRIYDQDEGFSGKNMNRPSFQQMMADVKNNMLDIIIVYKLDRISRNVQEFSTMYEIFHQHNVSFVSVKESFDTTSSMGRTVMYILAAFAQLERENTSERVADNMHALGATGKWTGGKCPTGMRSIRQKSGGKEHSYLLIDNEKIWLPKLLYRLLLEGYSITGVEQYCKNHGIKSQTGKFLNTSQIYGILTNPVYCQNSMEVYYHFYDAGCSLPDPALFDETKGLIGYGKTKTDTISQKRLNHSEWSIAIGIHEPVISGVDWIATQKRLGINKFIKTAKYDVGILKGVLTCPCGSRMEVRSYTKNKIVFSYYYCAKMARQGKTACNTGYIRVKSMEDDFLCQLKKIRLDPEGFYFDSQASEAIRNSGIVKSEIAKVNEAINNLTSALMQAMDSPASAYIVKQIGTLDKQKRELENELRNVYLLESTTKSATEAKKEIYENICYLLDNFENIDYKGKNELIRKVVQKCIYNENKLQIFI